MKKFCCELVALGRGQTDPRSQWARGQLSCPPSRLARPPLASKAAPAQSPAVAAGPLNSSAESCPPSPVWDSQPEDPGHVRGSVNTPELKQRVNCFCVVTFAEEEPVSMSFAWGPMGPTVRTADLGPFSFFSDDVAHAPTQTHAGAPVLLPSCLCLKHLLPATGPHPTAGFYAAHPRCTPATPRTSSLWSHTHPGNSVPGLQFKQHPTSVCTWHCTWCCTWHRAAVPGEAQ